jgi:hypothetical protein
MRKIQNANISFRANEKLKRQLTAFCEERELSNSLVIRQALSAFLVAQTRMGPSYLPLSKALLDSIGGNAGAS